MLLHFCYMDRVWLQSRTKTLGRCELFLKYKAKRQNENKMNTIHKELRQ